MLKHAERIQYNLFTQKITFLFTDGTKREYTLKNYRQINRIEELTYRHSTTICCGLVFIHEK